MTSLWRHFRFTPNNMENGHHAEIETWPMVFTYVKTITCLLESPKTRSFCDWNRHDPAYKPCTWFVTLETSNSKTRRDVDFKFFCTPSTQWEKTKDITKLPNYILKFWRPSYILLMTSRSTLPSQNGLTCTDVYCSGLQMGDHLIFLSSHPLIGQQLFPKILDDAHKAKTNGNIIN